MAEGQITPSTPESNFINKCGAEEDNECIYCYKLKHELDFALQDLSSVKKIIQILQEERNSTLNPDAVSTGNENSGVDQTFEIVRAKPGRKKLTSIKVENNGLMKMQHTESILTTGNKYAPLACLQAEQETSQKHSKIGNAIIITKNKLRCSPIVKKRKIIIIGGSHTRGLAHELKYSLGKDFEVSGTMMPGARLENITNLSAEGISTLGKKDAVVIWGGANDINKNEVNNGLKYLINFVNNRQNTNIIVVSAPHRYDLDESSCVNKEVVFNRKLHKIIKTVDNVELVQTKLNRNDFTRHGLHLNISGKGKIAELIGEHIKNHNKNKVENLITLKWKEN
jgi:lysophospholipase L1-like esterase